MLRKSQEQLERNARLQQTWEAQTAQIAEVRKRQPAVDFVLFNQAVNLLEQKEASESTKKKKKKTPAKASTKKEDTEFDRIFCALQEKYVFARVAPELTIMALGGGEKWPVVVTFQQMSQCFLNAGFAEEKWWDDQFRARLVVFAANFELNYPDTSVVIHRTKPTLKFHNDQR